MNTMNTTTTTTTTGNSTLIASLNSIVLVKFSSSAPATSLLHKTATAETCAQHGVTRGKARTHVDVIPTKGTAVGRARSIINGCAAEIRQFALPCNAMPGASYLQAAEIDKVQDIFLAAEAKLNAAKREIIDEWDRLVAQAKADINTLADTIDYPTGEGFASQFGIRLDWLSTPAPIAGTVLGKVSEETAARVAASSAETARRDLLAAHGAPVRDLIASIGKCVDQIRDGKRLRKEAVGNVTDAADRLRKLNWAAMPELDSLVKAVEESVGGMPDAPDMTKDERSLVAEKLDGVRVQSARTLASLGI
jgi:hypothetical protein